MTFVRGQLVRVRHRTQEHGIMAGLPHLEARQDEGALGEVKEVYGDLVWLRHGWGALAPYWAYELVLVGDPNAKK